MPSCYWPKDDRECEREGRRDFERRGYPDIGRDRYGSDCDRAYHKGYREREEEDRHDDERRSEEARQRAIRERAEQRRQEESCEYERMREEEEAEEEADDQP